MADQSAEERRLELLKAKDELIQIMRQVIEPINQITCRLVSEADGLINEVMREKTTTLRTKRIKYSNDPPALSETTLTGPPKLGPGKRACSICRKPGHRASTCPQRKDVAFNDIG